MEQVMWDTVGLVISKASQYAVEIAALIVAWGTIWRLWLRPARDRVYRTMISVEAMADLVTTEFKTNGGSSIKDAVVQTLEWQRAHDVQHAEAKRPAAQSVPARRRTRVVKD